MGQPPIDIAHPVNAAPSISFLWGQTTARADRRGSGCGELVPEPHPPAAGATISCRRRRLHGRGRSAGGLHVDGVAGRHAAGRNDGDGVTSRSIVLPRAAHRSSRQRCMWPRGFGFEERSRCRQARSGSPRLIRWLALSRFSDGRTPLVLNPTLNIAVTAADTERTSAQTIGVRFYPNGSSSGATIKPEFRSAKGMRFASTGLPAVSNRPPPCAGGGAHRRSQGWQLPATASRCRDLDRPHHSGDRVDGTVPSTRHRDAQHWHGGQLRNGKIDRQRLVWRR